MGRPGPVVEGSIMRGWSVFGKPVLTDSDSVDGGQSINLAHAYDQLCYCLTTPQVSDYRAWLDQTVRVEFWFKANSTKSKFAVFADIFDGYGSKQVGIGSALKKTSQFTISRAEDYADRWKPIKTGNWQLTGVPFDTEWHHVVLDFSDMSRIKVSLDNHDTVIHGDPLDKIGKIRFMVTGKSGILIDEVSITGMVCK